MPVVNRSKPEKKMQTGMKVIIKRHMQTLLPMRNTPFASNKEEGI